MRRLRWILPLAVLALVASGVAIAAHKGSPKTDAVTATFSAERAAVKEQTCTGADGAYREAREVFNGTVESSDARLDGAVTFHVRSLVNTATGLGTVEGHAWFRAEDGDVKGKAKLFGVTATGGAVHGMLVGKVKGEGKGELVASFNGTFGSAAPFAFSGEIGASGGGAVIQSGHCHGPKKDKDD